MPTVKISMPAAFVRFASFCVSLASMFAWASVTRKARWGTFGRTPLPGANIVSLRGDKVNRESKVKKKKVKYNMLDTFLNLPLHCVPHGFRKIDVNIFAVGNL